MTRTELIAELTKVQNDTRNWNRDILSITGMGMTDEQVAQHLKNERLRLAADAVAA